jgi:hypothetical protein
MPVIKIDVPRAELTPSKLMKLAEAMEVLTGTDEFDIATRETRLVVTARPWRWS